MYWGNYAWAAYTPINSNESFDNTGNIYNVTRILGDDGYVNVDAYKEYGPPYFSGEHRSIFLSPSIPHTAALWEGTPIRGGIRKMIDEECGADEMNFHPSSTSLYVISSIFYAFFPLYRCQRVRSRCMVQLVSLIVILRKQHFCRVHRARRSLTVRRQIMIRYWGPIRRAGYEMYRSIRYRKSMYEGNDDAHTRMIAKYKEVPELWYLGTLLIAFAFGIAALAAFPTHTAFWCLFAVAIINFIFLIPSAIMVAGANVKLSTGLFFQMFSGCVFRGNPEANIIANACASNFNNQTDNFVSDLKLAHYAKLPPRAVFRAQLIATFVRFLLFSPNYAQLIAKSSSPAQLLHLHRHAELDGLSL